MFASQRLRKWLGYSAIYLTLTFFALVMLFPFLVMLFTSFKQVSDTFIFPPRLLPRVPVSAEVAGFEQPLPLYRVEFEGDTSEFVLLERSVRVGYFAPPANLETTYLRELDQAPATGETAVVNGVEQPLYRVELDGAFVPMVLLNRTAMARFANPEDLSQTVLASLRTTPPVERIAFTLDNYRSVTELHAMDRSLTNTALVTIGVVLGQLTTSILGGYAFARLQFPGRDRLFVVYLGTIMVPFVVLITPLYQLMVMIGWVDRLASLIIPWIFTAYGTFLMRQFFLSVPKEIEEAAIIDGASRLQILWRIFIPASTPALASLTTFTFLYAWNSFFWPLVIINTGNENNRVLTLALSVLGGRAADSPNLVLAGAAIAVLPPVLIYVLGQRFFVESATSSGVKG